MNAAAWIIVGGLGVGLLYGVFGVGSAFGTPVLSLLGVPGMAAVVGPLPALLPGSVVGAWSYTKQGKVDWRVARSALAGAVPGAVVGAILSRWIGGSILLLGSGVVLFVVGARTLWPGQPLDPEIAARRRQRAGFVLVAAAGIGLASGLLANGGGFLLVPLFLLALGLDMNEAAGTSLVVAAALTVPTLITHAVLGDIDWPVAGCFALGLIPGVLVGSRLAPRLPVARLQQAFGLILVVFAAWFITRHVG